MEGKFHRKVRRQVAPVAGWAAAVLALAITLRLNIFTLTQISRSGTRVPWADEWLMIREFADWRRGGSLWHILWSSYWGHRLVIPRLIFFADMRWASHAPLLWLTLTVQFAFIGLLLALAWILLGRVSPLLFAVACVAVLNLMLSPSQMENFTWSMQTMFPLVYGAGAAAILCLSVSSGKRPVLFRGTAVAFGLIASLTMPNGLLIWPVMAVQSIYLKLERRVTALVGVCGIVVIILYVWHYEKPVLGMGAIGAMRHPLDAVMLVGLLLGAPFDSLPPTARIATALASIGLAAYLTLRALRRKAPATSAVTALIAVNAFLLLSAASIVVGRLDPTWLHNPQLSIPSRYFTLICAIWATAAILILHAWRERLLNPVAGCWFAALFTVLLFFQPSHLLERAEDWADFFRGADAVGAALLTGAPDEQLLRYLLDDPGIREPATSFMRETRMGIFGEPRATWMGRRITELWQPEDTDRCVGELESAVAVNGPGGVAWRIEGWAVDRSIGQTPDDLIVTDASGQIVGLARGGLRHRYIPAFITDAKTAVFHAGVRAAEWLGYVRPVVSRPWVIWGVGTAAVCRVAEVR